MQGLKSLGFKSPTDALKSSYGWLEKAPNILVALKRLRVSGLMVKGFTALVLGLTTKTGFQGLWGCGA